MSRLFASHIPPASDISHMVLPEGDCRAMSRSSGNVWNKPTSFTFAFRTTPCVPATASVLGYGLAGPDVADPPGIKIVPIVQLSAAAIAVMFTHQPSAMTPDPPAT